MSVFSLTAGTESGLVDAFDQFEALPKSCQSETIPGTVYLATDRTSKVSYAVAGFRPSPRCATSIHGKPFPPDQYGPFGTDPPPPVGLFTKAHGTWVMESETGRPFPCPPYLDEPYVPLDVLQAWHMPYYSSSCITTIPNRPE